MRSCGYSRFSAPRTALVVVLLLFPAFAFAQPRTTYRNEGLPGIVRLLKRVDFGGRVLHVGAHPDDEDSALLAWLSLGRGARTTYLSLTRGEGGQNLIGPELFEDLGVLRTAELLAAREVDGCDQLFGRTIDFGFSKTPEECFEKWGREEVVKDVVRAIRRTRPHVVISRFWGDEKDGHGQHQAAAIATREAFRRAADPKSFPELEKDGLKPWQAQKLYAGRFSDGPDVTIRIDTGEYDPIRGRSYAATGYKGRSLHRSQDMGMIEHEVPPRGSLYSLVDVAGEAEGKVAPGDAETDLFANVAVVRPDVSPTAGELLARPGALSDPSSLAPGIAELLRQWRAKTPDDEDALRDIQWAVGMALGIRLEAFADRPAVFAGAVPTEYMIGPAPLTNELRARFKLSPHSNAPLDSPKWSAQVEPHFPGPVTDLIDRIQSRDYDVAWTDLEGTTVEGSIGTQWANYPLFAPEGSASTAQENSPSAGLPFEPARLARFEARYSDVPFSLSVPLEYRDADPSFGEIRRDLRDLPRASVRFAPSVAILRATPEGMNDAPHIFTEVVNLTDSDFMGTLTPSFRLSEWKESHSWEPLEVKLGPFRNGRYAITLPNELPAGSNAEIEMRWSFQSAKFNARLEAERLAPGLKDTTPTPPSEPAFTASLLDYRHIRPRWIVRPAVGELRILDVSVPEGLRIGYVEGPADAIPGVLRDLGVEVETLDAKALASADLSGFDAVVLGPRAYETRADLVANNARVLDYARGGGTLVVQYNKYPFADGGLAPFPITIANPHDRVTREDAPVTLLKPEHPIFRFPNEIRPKDFDGWVQERGLYFWSSWDDAYEPLMECADPGEEPKRGGLLIAPLGEGRYIYAALAFFRQLPEGVEGAARLFVNLIAHGRAPGR